MTAAGPDNDGRISAELAEDLKSLRQHWIRTVGSVPADEAFHRQRRKAALVARVRQALNDGVSDREIGRVLRVTAHTVRCWVREARRRNGKTDD